MTARYLLCPGLVRSRSDGDVHYITGRHLAHLYGVPMEQCVELPDLLSFKSTLARHELLKRADRGELVSLYPRVNGDYRLPEVSSRGAA